MTCQDVAKKVFQPSELSASTFETRVRRTFYSLVPADGDSLVSADSRAAFVGKYYVLLDFIIPAN
jgi:hypothetical protein